MDADGFLHLTVPKSLIRLNVWQTLAGIIHPPLFLLPTLPLYPVQLFQTIYTRQHEVSNYLCDDEEVFAGIALSDNLLTIIKLDWLQSISDCQALPLVKALCHTQHTSTTANSIVHISKDSLHSCQHTHTHTHAHVHMHTHAHAHIHTHTHTHACTHARTHARTHAHRHTCTHTHTQPQPFNDQYYPGKPVPEETLTHSHTQGRTAANTTTTTTTV